MEAITRQGKAVTPAIEIVEAGIVRGYQRGRELGWPTANVDPDAYSGLDLACGVYYGWATISSTPNTRYKAVLSIGFNPTFDNQDKSLEVYLVHDFGRDFYEDRISVSITGYVRPMAKIPYELLHQAIREDVDFACAKLECT